MCAARPGRTWITPILATVLSLACVAISAAATPEQVDEAIKKGQDYLYSKLRQKPELGAGFQKPELSTAKDTKQIEPQGPSMGRPDIDCDVRTTGQRRKSAGSKTQASD